MEYEIKLQLSSTVIIGQNFCLLVRRRPVSGGCSKAWHREVTCGHWTTFTLVTVVPGCVLAMVTATVEHVCEFMITSSFWKCWQPLNIKENCVEDQGNNLEIMFLLNKKSTKTYFLALLNFVSKATVRPASVRPSVVCKLKFLGNRWIDPGQILWVAPSPPYLQTIFFFFQNFQFSNFYDFFSFSLTWDPMRAKISKRYSTSIFHPIWAKFYHKLGSHEGIEGYGRYWRSAKILKKV